MSPSVSVIIPTYNGAGFIAEALASVFAQTLPPREIIIVDDCSTDDTPDVVEKIARQAPIPLRLIRLPRNSGGPAHPMNVGIAAAQGDLIAVLDQDDVFLPRKLEVQAGLLAADEDLSWVFSCVSIDLENPPKAYAPAPSVIEQLLQSGTPAGSGVHLRGETVLRTLLLRGNFSHYGYPGFMFRRRDWQRRGIDESFAICSDYDFMCWLCAQGAATFVPEVLFRHRVHAGNLSGRSLPQDWEVFRIRCGHAASSGLLADVVFREPLFRELFGFAYSLRQSGHYLLAFCAFLRVGLLFGWDRRLIASVLKLGPHWLCRVAVRPTWRWITNCW